MATRRKTAPTDSIAAFLNEWQVQRPDLDPWPLGILGRVSRISLYLQRHSQSWLAPLGLTWETFSMIAALRRAGPPFAQKPSDLLRMTLLTSGAMTNRIDRVEAKGWVERLPDPGDRRSVIVRLTPRGKALADRAIALHFEEAAQLLGFLSKSDRALLEALLSQMLGRLEKAD